MEATEKRAGQTKIGSDKNAVSHMISARILLLQLPMTDLNATDMRECTFVTTIEKKMKTF